MSAATLYQRALGEDFSQLHPLLKAFHQGAGHPWQGAADVVWPTQRLLRCALWLARLPHAGQQVPLHVQTLAQGKDAGELWRRCFAQQLMASHQSLQAGHIVERFGPMALVLDSRVRLGAMHQTSLKSTFLSLPLPRFCSLSVEATEWVQDGRFRFEVRIGLGRWRMLRYSGWLVPVNMEEHPSC